MKNLSLGEWGFLIVVILLILSSVFFGVNLNDAALGNADVAIEGGTLTISANGDFTYTNSEGFDFDPLIFCNDDSVRWNNNKEQP